MKKLILILLLSSPLSACGISVGVLCGGDPYCYDKVMEKFSFTSETYKSKQPTLTPVDYEPPVINNNVDVDVKVEAPRPQRKVTTIRRKLDKDGNVLSETVE